MLQLHVFVDFSFFSAFDLLRHILLGSISSSYYGDAFKTRNDCKCFLF